MAIKTKRLARQAGFTLLELMVVIVILGVLASMVVPNLMGNKEKADAQKATSDIVALEGSLDMYKLDNHRYPTTEQGLALPCHLADRRCLHMAIAADAFGQAGDLCRQGQAAGIQGGQQQGDVLLVLQNQGSLGAAFRVVAEHV